MTAVAAPAAAGAAAEARRAVLSLHGDLDDEWADLLLDTARPGVDGSGA